MNCTTFQPNEAYIMVSHPGLKMMTELEVGDKTPGWVSIGYVAQQGILIDEGEWDAFVQLINESDAVRKLNRSDACPIDKNV